MQQYTHSHLLMLVCVAAPEDAELLDHWERHFRPLEQASLVSVWSELHLVAGYCQLGNRAEQDAKITL